MTVPWNDWVTATIDGDEAREIVVEGPLRDVVAALAGRPLREQMKIVLAFPDRQQPPYRFTGDEIAPLMRQLHTDKRIAERAEMECRPDNVERRETPHDLDGDSEERR